jgi:DNA-binding NarL/FixJ family response regulator
MNADRREPKCGLRNEPARILVADDDPSFRKLIVRLLEHEGHRVEQAADAREALARMSTELFDLLIADVHMPGNDGLAVLHAQAVVPVLIVTGDPTVETAIEALRGAAVDYLTKPLAPERLLARVADGIARGRRLRSLYSAELRLREQLDLVTLLRDSLLLPGAATAGAPEPPRSELPPTIAELLSPREREVLTAFATSPRTATVAEGLHISPHTVKNHMKAIFKKLAVGSQAELLARLGEAARGGR